MYKYECESNRTKREPIRAETREAPPGSEARSQPAEEEPHHFNSSDTHTEAWFE